MPSSLNLSNHERQLRLPIAAEGISTVAPETRKRHAGSQGPSIAGTADENIRYFSQADFPIR